jgi:carbon-monoxide dehydrogenase medium subunit
MGSVAAKVALLLFSPNLPDRNQALKRAAHRDSPLKPPPFRYHDPATVEEAVRLLAQLENARLLAGGQSLMPMLNMRYVLPDDVIDLNRVEGLAYIREAGGALEIGAMTRQRDIELSPAVRELCPLMHEAIVQVGHRQTRNRGTLGGSLCHLDPAAELVTVAAALDATVIAAGPGGAREVRFGEFAAGYMTPALAPDEMVTAARFPLWPRGHGHAFVEFSRRHGDFAVVSAAALLAAGPGGKVTRASLTVGGATAAPVRVAEAERMLVGQAPADALLREAAEHCRKVDAMGDVHAPAAYRRQLAAVLARRALEKARSRLSASGS